MATLQNIIDTKYDKLLAEKAAYLKTIFSEKLLAILRKQGATTYEQIIALTTISYNERKFGGSLSGINHLKNLTVLQMHTNDLDSIGDISSLTALKSVNLSYNNLTSIGSVFAMTGLTSLRLNNNNLSNIGALQNFDSLTELRLNNNQFETFPLYSFSWTSLIEFNMYNNKLTTETVDAILAAAHTAVVAGAPLDILQLSGGTNGVPTGGASNADYVYLAANITTCGINT